MWWLSVKNAVAYPEDSSSVPNSHIRCLTTTRNSNFKDPMDAFFDHSEHYCSCFWASCLGAIKTRRHLYSLRLLAFLLRAVSWASRPNPTIHLPSLYHVTLWLTSFPPLLLPQLQSPVLFIKKATPPSCYKKLISMEGEVSQFTHSEPISSRTMPSLSLSVAFWADWELGHPQTQDSLTFNKIISESFTWFSGRWGGTIYI